MLNENINQLQENANALSEASSEFKNLIEGLESGAVTFEQYDGEIDNEFVERYRSRFIMFVEDGVSRCINDYLAKVQTEDVNDATKMKVSLVALNIIAGGNGDV